MSNDIVKVSGGVEISVEQGIPVNIVTGLVLLAAKQFLHTGMIITHAVAEYNHHSEVIVSYYSQRTRAAIDLLSVPALFDAYKMAKHMIDRLELSAVEREKAYMDLASKLDKRREMY